MRRKLIVLTMILLASPLKAQDGASASAPDPSMLDFWLGTWDLSWIDNEGKTGEGENVVSKIQSGKIVHERFRALKGSGSGFSGESWSGIDPSSKRWRQTWVDNSGNFMVFDGHQEGEERTFQRLTTAADGAEVVQRMVFSDIERDSFTWRWEASRDKGKTWSVQWKIQYKRRK